MTVDEGFSGTQLLLHCSAISRLEQRDPRLPNDRTVFSKSRSRPAMDGLFEVWPKPRTSDWRTRRSAHYGRAHRRHELLLHRGSLPPRAEAILHAVQRRDGIGSRMSCAHLRHTAKKSCRPALRTEKIMALLPPLRHRTSCRPKPEKRSRSGPSSRCGAACKMRLPVKPRGGRDVRAAYAIG